jgi:hypothetical protein
VINFEQPLLCAGDYGCGMEQIQIVAAVMDGNDG